MKKCTLLITDEVNVRFSDVDADTRRQLHKASKFFIPSSKFSMSYKLGRWDGTTSFCDLAGRTYLNFIDRLIPILVENNYELEIVDQREHFDFQFEPIDKDSYKHVHWPKDHATAPKLPIELKEHQVDYINTFLAGPQGIGVAPTGSGKTVVSAILADKIGKYGRSIIIVPTKDLVKQTERDYRLLGLDVGVYYGDRKDYGNQHVICTWQSLSILIKKTKSKQAGCTINQFLDGVVGVICDETHKAKGKELRDMLTGAFSDIPIRWGMTGTIPKEEWEAVTLEIAIGQVLGRITAKELQDKGILANLHVNIMQLMDPDYHSGSYHGEYTWLTTNADRIKFLAKTIHQISQDGNTLILVDRITTGEKLEALLPGSVFISGRDKSIERFQEYNEMKTSTNKIIIATYGVASTGIDIGRVFNMVLLEAGKSFVRVIQSIGRGIRVAEDKDFVNVFDICSSAKYSKKHLCERKKFYKESEYPFTITKVPW